MNFIPNKKINYRTLEKRFSCDIDNLESIISNNGSLSTVVKVYDKNGDIYAGKLPKIELSPQFSTSLYDNLKNFDYISSSRSHEYDIAKKIFEINKEYTPKPEGVFAIKVKKDKEEYFLPAFVNEFDKSLFSLNTPNSKLNLPKDFDKSLVKEHILKDLYKKDFQFGVDSFFDQNFLCSKDGKKIKIIDFGYWAHNNIVNPSPKNSFLHGDDLKEYYNSIFEYSEMMLE